MTAKNVGVEITAAHIVDALNERAPLFLQVVDSTGEVLWKSDQLPLLTVNGSVCFKVEESEWH